mgnify:FL=1
MVGRLTGNEEFFLPVPINSYGKMNINITL